MNNAFKGDSTLPQSKNRRIHISAIIISEGKLRRFCSLFSLVLAGFSERAFKRKPQISTKRNDRLQGGELLNVIEHIGSKKESFQYHCFDIQGAVAFQTRFFFVPPGMKICLCCLPYIVLVKLSRQQLKLNPIRFQ